MVAASNLLLLPPPGSRRSEGPRVDDSEQRRKTNPNNDNTAGFAEDFAAAGAFGSNGTAARQRPRVRSFADELVGESGRASGGLTFATQRIAQERLRVGAHIENWRQATAAYAQTVRNAEPKLGSVHA
jgi:hypothetical protein